MGAKSGIASGGAQSAVVKHPGACRGIVEMRRRLRTTHQPYRPGAARPRATSLTPPSWILPASSCVGALARSCRERPDIGRGARPAESDAAADRLRSWGRRPPGTSPHRIGTMCIRMCRSSPGSSRVADRCHSTRSWGVCPACPAPLRADRSVAGHMWASTFSPAACPLFETHRRFQTTRGEIVEMQRAPHTEPRHGHTTALPTTPGRRVTRER